MISIILGFAAMEGMGLLGLAGVRALGYGSGPWALSAHTAFPLAFGLGLLATAAAGRLLGMLDLGEIDAYSDRIGAMHAMERSGRRVRAPQRRVHHRPVAIQY